MNTIKVTVGNSYFHNVIETFICANVDVSDKNEMEYAAAECCGEYLDMCNDLVNSCADVPFETIANACYYTIEEVVNNGTEF